MDFIGGYVLACGFWVLVGSATALGCGFWCLVDLVDLSYLLSGRGVWVLAFCGLTVILRFDCGLVFLWVLNLLMGLVCLPGCCADLLVCWFLGCGLLFGLLVLVVVFGLWVL